MEQTQKEVGERQEMSRANLSQSFMRWERSCGGAEGGGH